jgi:hypothetical protein
MYRNAVKFSCEIGVTLVFCVLLGFPLFNDLTGLVAEKAPHGIAQIENKLRFSVPSFLNKRYQKKATELAKKRSGYWGPFTLIGNQILLSAFYQISAFYNGSIIWGADGQVIQTAHLNHFNRRPDVTIDAKKLEARFLKLKQLQDEQQKRGKAVIVLISPNVIELYPQSVPDSFIDKTRLDRKSSYEHTKKRMDELNIRYIDGPQILEQAKSKYPFRLWAKTAAHWNDVASCLVMSELNQKLINESLPSFDSFSCENWTMHYPPKNKDLDLIKLANVRFPHWYYEQTPYIDISKDPDRKKLKKPRVVMVGTSYLFAVSEMLKSRKLSDRFVHYFYYRQRTAQNTKGLHRLVKQHIPWKEVLDREITIIDAPMRQTSSLGYGFVEDAHKKLRKLNS